MKCRSPVRTWISRASERRPTWSTSASTRAGATKRSASGPDSSRVRPACSVNAGQVDHSRCLLSTGNLLGGARHACEGVDLPSESCCSLTATAVTADRWRRDATIEGAEAAGLFASPWRTAYGDLFRATSSVSMSLAGLYLFLPICSRFGCYFVFLVGVRCLCHHVGGGVSLACLAVRSGSRRRHDDCVGDAGAARRAADASVDEEIASDQQQEPEYLCCNAVATV